MFKGLPIIREVNCLCDWPAARGRVLFALPICREVPNGGRIYFAGKEITDFKNVDINQVRAEMGMVSTV